MIKSKKHAEKPEIIKNLQPKMEYMKINLQPLELIKYVEWPFNYGITVKSVLTAMKITEDTLNMLLAKYNMTRFIPVSSDGEELEKSIKLDDFLDLLAITSTPNEIFINTNPDELDAIDIYRKYIQKQAEINKKESQK